MNIRHLTGRVDPNVLVNNRTKQGSDDAKATAQGESFADVLGRISQQKGINFSGHAIQRLEERNINLQQDDISRISEAVDRAEKKGSNESLVLDGQNAYIVNVKNRTIVTAVDQLELREKVFTKIDSAVFTQMHS